MREITQVKRVCIICQAEYRIDIPPQCYCGGEIKEIRGPLIRDEEFFSRAIIDKKG